MPFNKCIQCELCYKVCPGIGLNQLAKESIQKNPFAGKVLGTLTGKAMDEAIYTNGQSGGVVTGILDSLFRNDYITAALVAYEKEDIPPRGEVLVVDKSDDLAISQKSKYMPIPLLSGLEIIRKYEGTIAIVGLACHMHGLAKLLEFDRRLAERKIIRIGLVCERTLLNTAIDFFGLIYHKDKICHITFKDKLRPKYPGNSIIKSIDGYEIEIQPEFRMMIKDFFTPARCRLCFDKLNVLSDITVGDPHGIKRVDRIHGESLVIVRTPQGREIVEIATQSKDILLRDINTEEALRGQGVTKKASEWKSYMSAWNAMGRHLPDLLSVKIDTKAGSKYIKNLRRALKIDTYRNRDKLFQKAKVFLLRKKIEHLIIKLIDKIYLSLINRNGRRNEN